VDHGIINDMAICIMVAWLLAVGAHLFKQPLILAYLVAGFVIGPLGLKWVAAQESVQTISSLGLILLLFMIGLEIDLKKILGAGRLITVTGVSQIAGSFLLGCLFFWLLAKTLGFQMLEIIYLAAAVSLSSTVIVVKLLYDKRELNTLPGRITLGILVLQDLFAILFLAIQPELGSPSAGPIFLALLKVLFLVAISFTASRYALPQVFRLVSRLPEIVTVGALAWCFLIGGLGEKLGLSREMGALVAGVALSTFPYTLDVTAKVTSLRDFFLTLFFVALGMTIPLPTLAALGWALVVGAFILLSRVLTVFLPLLWMSHGHRASLLPALNLCQISEFSLVIFAIGAASGHVSEGARGILAYAFVLLAVGSTYAIMQSDTLARLAGRGLKALKVADLDAAAEAKARPRRTPPIFLLGFSWTASSLLEEISRHDRNLINELRVIDFNPHVNQELRQRSVDVVYGDISQRDTLEHAGLGEARIILCTLPNTILKGINNLRLVQMLREINPKAQIIVYSEIFSDIPDLYAAGASYVCLPRLIEAAEVLSLLKAARENLLDEKRAELDRELADRHEVIP